MTERLFSQDIGDSTLIFGDCLKAMENLPQVDHIITDPPYEAVTQDKWGNIKRTDIKNGRGRFHKILSFTSIDHIRQPVADAAKRLNKGWGIFFCQAEGVRAHWPALYRL